MNAFSSLRERTTLPPLQHLGLLALIEHKPPVQSRSNLVKRSYGAMLDSQGNPSQPPKESKNGSHGSLRADGRGQEQWNGLFSPLPTPPLLPNLLPYEIVDPLSSFYSPSTPHRVDRPTMSSPRSNPASLHSATDSTTDIPPRSSLRSISPSATTAPTANTFLTDQGLFIRRKSNQKIAKIDWTELEGWLAEIVQDGQGKKAAKKGMRLANGHPWRCHAKDSVSESDPSRQ